MANINVSGTYRPPYGPNRPRASGRASGGAVDMKGLERVPDGARLLCRFGRKNSTGRPSPAPAGRLLRVRLRLPQFRRVDGFEPKGLCFEVPLVELGRPRVLRGRDGQAEAELVPAPLVSDRDERV